MANDRDPRTDLGAWLGEELRTARTAADYSSQDALARELGFDRTTINKAETGERPPSDLVSAKIAEKFPGLSNGLYAQLATIARKSNGKFPGWFERGWLPIEREATSLRWWEPIHIPGLLQTGDYARSLFQAWQPASSGDDLDALVNGRLERQNILDRDNPPDLRVVLDEAALHRLLGAFILAKPSGTLYLETAVEAQITGDDTFRERATLIFDRLTDDALPRGASRDLILKVAEEQWNV